MALADKVLDSGVRDRSSRLPEDATAFHDHVGGVDLTPVNRLSHTNTKYKEVY